jgi:hypothetical protein
VQDISKESFDLGVFRLVVRVLSLLLFLVQTPTFSLKFEINLVKDPEDDKKHVHRKIGSKDIDSPPPQFILQVSVPNPIREAERQITHQSDTDLVEDIQVVHDTILERLDGSGVVDHDD